MPAPRPALACAALALLVAAQPARAQGCLTEPEFAAMATYALPSALEGTMRTCQPQLAADGYFARSGAALVSRYAARKDAAWPQAKAAFFKLGDAKDAALTKSMAALPDSALRPFVEGMVSEMITQKLKPGQCKAIERATMLLAPLPPENTAQLLAFVIAQADSKSRPGHADRPMICPVKA